MSSPGCRAGLRCCAPGASPAEQFTLSLWGDRPAPHSNHGYFASHQFISSDSSVAPSGAPPAAQTVMGMQTLMYYDSNSTQTRHLSLPIQTYPNNTPVTRADLNVTDPTSAARLDCSHPSVALQVSCSGCIRWPRNGYNSSFDSLPAQIGNFHSQSTLVVPPFSVYLLGTILNFS